MVAVQESQPCTEQELRLCVMSLHYQLYSAKKAADDMAGAIHEGKPSMKLRANFWQQDAETRFRSNKMPVDEYLGPGNTPGTPEHQKRLRIGKAILKKATGIEL